MTDERQITITEDGPYEVSGPIPLIEQTIAGNERGESIAWTPTDEFSASASYQLCRCGKSGNKPFCDNSHAENGFDGTETASREPYAKQAERMEGPRFTLLDQEDLCALARFCDTHQTVWDEIEKSDDPEVAAILIDQVGNCVSGRLTLIDNDNGEPVLPGRTMRISTVQDPAEQCSGPLWVEGGVTIVAADGETYERRDRVALCRCGGSSNKPFCDGSHVDMDWSDKD